MKIKHKKWFSLLVALGSLTCVGIISPFAFSQSKKSSPSPEQRLFSLLNPEYKSNEKVDFKQAKNILNQPNNWWEISKQIEEIKSLNWDEETLNFYKSMQKKFIEFFEKNNMTLGEIGAFLKEKVPSSTCFQDKTRQKILSALRDSGHRQVGVMACAAKTNYYDALDKLDRAAKSLKALKASATAMSVASAAAAVAAGAALLIPVAIKCGCISAICATIAASADMALNVYDRNRSKLHQAAVSVLGVIKIGNSMSKILYPVLIGASTTIAICGWAFPTSLSLLPVIGLILSLIENFKEA